MDPGLIKGHFFMGQALVELGKCDDAIIHLKSGDRLIIRAVVCLCTGVCACV